MEQQTFDLPSAAKKTGPVTCLGMTFPDEAARRAHFTALLAEKLKDPEFRKIEGFPLGTDEDILALSDPPYYCACPNPWIDDFLKEWEAAKPPKPMGYKYEREPFAADVSEGKNDPIYTAHTYHTKVPFKAIIRYLLHYTDPGDCVADGFCGSGMTGVAAFMCGSRSVVQELGYRVDDQGAVYDPNSDTPSECISHIGRRYAVVSDLSPAATFIAANYNSFVSPVEFEEKAKRILAEVRSECDWMFQTTHVDGKGKPIVGSGGPVVGEINYAVWSDVFVCPHCGEEVIFWDVAVKRGEGVVLDTFECNRCHSKMNKRTARKAWTDTYEAPLNKVVKQAKQIPVLINYSVNGKRFEKRPDDADLDLIHRVEAMAIPYPFPVKELPKGFNTAQPKESHGVTHSYLFYTKRNLWTLAALWSKADLKMKFGLTNFLSRNLTRMNRFVVNNHNPNGRINGPMTGTLYIPSEQVEQNALKLFVEKWIKHGWQTSGNVVSTQSFSDLRQIPDATVDYLFIDPPFGANINYSELNSIWESWLGVVTDQQREAIENEVQKKDLYTYKDLMVSCLKEAYRVLKHGHWITIEFSNTRSSVWNMIQSALVDVGFVVANVSALDKKHGGIRSMAFTTSVKQDLVITAYKPDENFEARFKLESETEDGVWDFVRTHLSKLPVCKVKSGKLIAIPERDPRILFDQVVSYYVRKNLNVPISSRDFQEGLSVRYSQRDGMFFLPEQAAEYDKKKALQKYEVDEGAALFIHDEDSAISWLRSVLGKKPQTYSSVQPQYLQAPTSISKHEELPDLRELLKDNFLCYDAAKDGDVPSQIHTLLSTNYHELRNLPKDNPQLKEKADGMWYVPDPNKASDLEKLREKSLLKEFEAYRAEKKLKKFRLEVVRAGFKKAFADKDFATILGVGAKIPEDVINEDDKLLMWYNIAQRLGGR